MPNDTVAVDFRGNEIRVGDIVLYPRMSGRSCEMTEAEVVDIIPHENGRRVTNPAYDAWIREQKAAHPDTPVYEFARQDAAPPMMTTVPAWKFKLKRLRSTRFRFDYSWSDPEKPVTVQLGENVVRVMDA